VTQAKTNRRKLACYAAMVVVALLILRIPDVQHTVAGALSEFVEIAERTLRHPCALLDHDRCFTLDRLDPTCPPYL